MEVEGGHSRGKMSSLMGMHLKDGMSHVWPACRAAHDEVAGGHSRGENVLQIVQV